MYDYYDDNGPQYVVEDFAYEHKNWLGRKLEDLAYWWQTRVLRKCDHWYDSYCPRCGLGR